ncbi:unnamed protein product [Ectocarpus sp. 12 AP-2014]
MLGLGIGCRFLTLYFTLYTACCTRGRRIAIASAKERNKIARERRRHPPTHRGTRQQQEGRGWGSKRGLCMSQIFCVMWLPAERHSCLFRPHGCGRFVHRFTHLFGKRRRASVPAATWPGDWR